MDNAIITIVIRDRGSIIAAVTILLGHKVSVLDMAQNIIDGFFNMMLIEDCSDFGIPFDDLLDGLKTLGEGIGVKVCAQREEIFTSMHRVWGGAEFGGLMGGGPVLPVNTGSCADFVNRGGHIPAPVHSFKN